MSEVDAQSPDPGPPPAPQDPPPEHPSGWMAFNGRPVMLQLREPYIGVTYAHLPSMKGAGEVRATPVLSGQLFVEPSGTQSGLLLILRQIVKEGSQDFALIALDPSDVLYCTHMHEVEQSRIVAP